MPQKKWRRYKPFPGCQTGVEKWINGNSKKQKDFDEWLAKFNLKNVCHKVIIPILIFSLCQIILIVVVLIIVGKWNKSENVHDIQFENIQ